jgi:hypothetical protein
MKIFAARLNRIEGEIAPANQMALIFAMHPHNEKDVATKKREYEALYGNIAKLTFLILTNYGGLKAQLPRVKMEKKGL